MCMGATCPDCSKKSWRGCGKHIPSALSGVPEDEWCACEPKVEVDGKSYPHAARVAIPGASWLSGLVGGGGDQKKEGKDEL
ncbi:hypothetical protein FJTKL_10394 [Diaporthe vaccinii]|uniref:Uncharacterized protein n=1 Tax=Diaporthe vaccinii TaxID=105482 RepID=A0ABR4EK06_9PEZI